MAVPQQQQNSGNGTLLVIIAIVIGIVGYQQGWFVIAPPDDGGGGGGEEQRDEITMYDLAAVADAFARHVEYDGTLSDPSLTYTSHVWDAFNGFGSRSTFGKSAKAKFPAWFTETERELLTLDPGETASELTPSVRRRAVEIFQRAAERARNAA